MHIKTISFVYERKFNTGNYESATIGMTAWADVAEGEDEVKAARQLEVFVKDEVRAQSLPVLGKRAAQVKEFFAGLPEVQDIDHESAHGKEVAA